MTAESALALDEVTVAHGGFRLGPISLTVGRGEVLWLSGQNGSGKSTLLETVAGLRPLASGSVRVVGAVVAGSPRDVPPSRRDVAILLQGLGLWPHLSIERQCRLVAGASVAGQQIAGWADTLGISRLMSRKPRDLSGGEAQRAALLRTVAAGRSVVLLDEPYSAQHDEGPGRIDEIIRQLLAVDVAVVVAGSRAPPGARARSLS